MQYVNGLNFAIINTSTHSSKMNLANKIDDAMRKFKPRLTQTSLAKLSGVPQATISRTLKGSTIPEFETLAKLAKVLKITFDGFDLDGYKGVSGDRKPRKSTISNNEQDLLNQFRRFTTERQQIEVIGYVKRMADEASQSKSNRLSHKAKTNTKEAA